MERRLLRGVVCASICPMHEDGSVDYDSMVRFTRYQVENGIHCLYPNGTNGESISLTKEERIKIAETVTDANNGKAVVYIQCGASAVEESYELIRHSMTLKVDGAGLMTPVFFAIDDEAMFSYYDKILTEIGDFPVYAYNISPRTGTDIKPEILGRLMEKHSNLMGVKYSYPDLMRVEHYIDCCHSRRASVLVGNDSYAVASVTVGGDGWVSGPSAVFAKRHVNMWNALQGDNTKEANRIQRRIMRTADEMSGVPEIQAIKYMLMKQGIIECDTCRMPLRPLKKEEKERLDRILLAYESEE